MGRTVYIYESRRGEESRVLIKSDGSFIAELNGAKIERSELLQSMQVDVQIDGAYGTAMVNLKVAGRDECRRHDEEFFEHRDADHDSDGRKFH